MKGKKLFVLLLLFVLAFCSVGCKSDAEKEAEQAKENWEQSSSETKMGIYCALIKESMLLTEQLGEDTPYPAMKRSVKGSMMSSGMTQAEALDYAEEQLIAEQAVFWRAEKEGISATDTEVEAYIKENVIDQLKAAEEYESVDEMCAEEGITFEDTVWAYKNTYKMEYIAKQSDVEDYEGFQTYTEESVKEYKQSDAYQAFQSVLDTCRKLIEEDVTDKEILKSSDIYYN